MKKPLSIIILTASISSLFFSCSDDDSGVDANKELELAQNASEDREIPASELSQNVTIEGATKNSGSAPAPTGTIDFQISTDTQEGFLDNGFNVTFSSNSNVAGAYIQLLDVNGNKADGYFDVPASSFEINGRRRSGSLKNSALGRVKEEGDLLINVDFGEGIQPGRFCYEICIYDEQENISRIEQICVEIEAWGGNASIVGEWIFDREEPADEFPNTTTIYCESGDSLTNVAYDQVIQEQVHTFVLNADGSYYEEYNGEQQELDFEQSGITCSVVYGEPEVDRDRYSGYWAFNEEEGTLTVIDFEYRDLNNPANDEVYENGSVYFEGVKAEIINDELVLSEPDEQEKVIFRRK